MKSRRSLGTGTGNTAQPKSGKLLVFDVNNVFSTNLSTMRKEMASIA